MSAYESSHVYNADELEDSDLATLKFIAGQVGVKGSISKMNKKELIKKILEVQETTEEETPKKSPKSPKKSPKKTPKKKTIVEDEDDENDEPDSFSKKFFGEFERTIVNLIKGKQGDLIRHLSASLGLPAKKVSDVVNDFDWGANISSIKTKSGKGKKKNLSLSEKIEGLESGKYYCLDIHRPIKDYKERPQLGLTYVFYKKLRIACKPDSPLLKDALKELDAKDAKPTSTPKEFAKQVKKEKEAKEKEKKTEKKPEKKAKDEKPKKTKKEEKEEDAEEEVEDAEEEKPKKKKSPGKSDFDDSVFKKNDMENYEDDNGFVYDRKKKVVIGTQGKDEVETLTKVDKKALKKLGYPYENLDEDEILESIADEVDS